MDQKRAKNSVFVHKNTFFAEILFAEHTLSEEVILNEVSLRGSPTIDNYFALNLHGVTSKMPQNNKCTHFCITNCHQRTKVLFDICFQLQINSVPCILLFFLLSFTRSKEFIQKMHMNVHTANQIHFCWKQ